MYPLPEYFAVLPRYSVEALGRCRTVVVAVGVVADAVAVRVQALGLHEREGVRAILHAVVVVIVVCVIACGGGRAIRSASCHPACSTVWHHSRSTPVSTPGFIDSPCVAVMKSPVSGFSNPSKIVQIVLFGPMQEISRLEPGYI